MTRADLMEAVEMAISGVPSLPDVYAWRIRSYAASVPRVAAGAWSIERGSQRCYCPASGAGLDRLRPDVRSFAALFDTFVGVTCERSDVLEITE